MAERLYRAQILLEPEQHKALKALAEQENRSLSDVARETLKLGLQAYLRQRSTEQRILLLKRMNRERETLRKRIGTVDRDFLREAREDRQAELEAEWSE